MAKPIVAVVGRPNVGKSTLFNKLIGKRVSIVDDTPGVTRDRIYGDAEWCGRKMMLIDTGGIEQGTDDVILAGMRSQAELAIDMANVIIFVVDVKSGVTASDADVAAMLQKSGKPIILCVNKCDNIGNIPLDFYEFYNLGLGDPVAVSSVPMAQEMDANVTLAGQLVIWTTLFSALSVFLAAFLLRIAGVF